MFDAIIWDSSEQIKNMLEEYGDVEGEMTWWQWQCIINFGWRWSNFIQQ